MSGPLENFAHIHVCFTHKCAKISYNLYVPQPPKLDTTLFRIETIPHQIRYTVWLITLECAALYHHRWLIDKTSCWFIQSRVKSFCYLAKFAGPNFAGACPPQASITYFRYPKYHKDFRLNDRFQYSFKKVFDLYCLWSIFETAHTVYESFECFNCVRIKVRLHLGNKHCHFSLQCFARFIYFCVCEPIKASLHFWRREHKANGNIYHSGVVFAHRISTQFEILIRNDVICRLVNKTDVFLWYGRTFGNFELFKEDALECRTWVDFVDFI